MSKHKFKVGDQVVANEKAKGYPVTKPGWKGVVDAIFFGGRTIVVTNKIGDRFRYPAPPDIFDLVEPATPEKIIIYRNGAEVVAKNTATGKTTYVKQHKEPGDFVLDLDVLRQALGAPVKTSDCFQPQVMAIRDLLYQHIVFNKIGAKTIWVIAGLPERQRRLDVARYLKAELIFMQAPKEECLKRALNDPERQDKERQRKIIEGYFRVLS